MKMKKILILSTTIFVSAPIVMSLACSQNPGEFFGGSVFTEYVRGNDLTLSLGVASNWHARSDLSSTKDITNEGYLDDFAHPSTENAKSYGQGDKEYFTELGIGTYIARSITDEKGYFEHVGEKYDVINSNEVNSEKQPIGAWKTELKKMAQKFDTYSNWKTDIDFSARYDSITKLWDDQESILKTKSDAFFANNSDVAKNIVLVRGTDDGNTGFDGIIPGWDDWSILGGNHATQLYDLSSLQFPELDANAMQKISLKNHLVEGKTENTKNNDLVEAFAGSVDYLVYLKTPKSEYDIKTSGQPWDFLNQMLSTDGKIIEATYDDWYLPFRGSAIGAFVASENIAKDIFEDEFTSSNWKNSFKKEDLFLWG